MFVQMWHVLTTCVLPRWASSACNYCKGIHILYYYIINYLYCEDLKPFNSSVFCFDNLGYLRSQRET